MLSSVYRDGRNGHLLREYMTTVKIQMKTMTSIKPS
jgi:hypothetical protein